MKTHPDIGSFLAATVFIASLLPTAALAQLAGADRAALVKEATDNCIRMQSFIATHKALPTAQYKTFCDCRAEFLAQHSTPRDYRNLKEQMIGLPQQPMADSVCSKKVFGREI